MLEGAMKIPRGLNLFNRKNNDSKDELEDGLIPSPDYANLSGDTRAETVLEASSKPIDLHNGHKSEPSNIPSTKISTNTTSPASSPTPVEPTNKPTEKTSGTAGVNPRPQKMETKTEPPKATVLSPEELETLWFELENNPNDEKKLARMLAHCRNTKGPAAVNAALLALAESEEAYLPHILLAKIDLAANRLYEALDYYRQLIEKDKTTDFVLLRMTADLGRLGFPDEMIKMVAPVYDPDSHNPYIGLNLLRAYKITGDHQGGSKLYADLQRCEDAEVKSALIAFDNAFFSVRDTAEAEPLQEETSQSISESENISSADQSDDSAHEKESFPEADSAQVVIAPEPNEGPQVEVSVSSEASDGAASRPEVASNPASANPFESFNQRPLMLRVPVWREFIPVLEDILPEPEKGPRIGLLQYSVASLAGVEGSDEMGEMFRVLSGGIPLLMAEQLMFSAPVSPMVLFPVSQSHNPLTGDSEPDVERLFEVCARESLDYLITGTITKQAELVTIRSWMLDRSKKSARIISQSAPMLALSEGLDAHAQELISHFEDKSYIIEVKRKGFVYSFPKPDTFFKQATALFRLSLRLLFAQGRYRDVQLDDSDDLLEVMADLCRMKPLSQNYLMMLLAGMIADREMGGDSYRNYRDLIYQNAQKMQYTACITSARKTIERVLRD